MQQQIPTYPSSHCRHDQRFVADDNGIGALFRDYGEKYIAAYKPTLVQIKLIRSIRICKTPAMGGKVYTCKNCKDKKYVYFGCGNSRCPKCQGIKRMQWQDKIANKILRCPYQHIVFTMPHLLNTLSRRNPTVLYNILMRSAWKTLKKCCAYPANLGATPGAIMVLHTFGSDLKYHIHVHALVSFGGLDNQGNWQWPKRKNKLVPFRQMRNTFRAVFVNALSKQYDELNPNISFNDLRHDLYKKAWCVHAEPPTTNTKVIEQYLGRYICRIGLSKNRFHYDSIHKNVTLTFKDYKNKNTNEVPKAQKCLQPLLAIHQIVQHCLPLYFQKCRYYGLHASASMKKNTDKLPQQIKNNHSSVRTVFQILKTMMGLEALQCENCLSTEFVQDIISSDPSWKLQFITLPYQNKSPPNIPKFIAIKHRNIPKINSLSYALNQGKFS